MALQDSGAREEFPSGAMRDTHEGKGRCDLLPVDVIMHLIPDASRSGAIMSYIHSFMYNGDIESLYSALRLFIGVRYPDECTAILDLSVHYEEGAAKYTPNNWKKGMPLHYYFDSAIRHYLKYLRGDSDEPHDRAFVWNIISAIWTVNHRPDLIDIDFENALE